MKLKTVTYKVRLTHVNFSCQLLDRQNQRSNSTKIKTPEWSVNPTQNQIKSPKHHSDISIDKSELILHSTVVISSLTSSMFLFTESIPSDDMPATIKRFSLDQYRFCRDN